MSKMGYLIYQQEEGIKNREFIRMFQNAGKEWSISFCMVRKEEYLTKPLPDLVLNRTRDPLVSRWYEKQGIPVFHTEDIVRLGNDKAAALRFLEETLPDSVRRERWRPRGFAVTPHPGRTLEQWKKEIQDQIGEVSDVVLKTADGHGGQEVLLLPGDPVTYRSVWEEACRRFEGRKLLCQQWIDSRQRDLRIYVLGGEIYAAVLRQGRADFRSNFSLGGEVGIFPLTSQQREYIEQFIKAFGVGHLAMAGIDFLIDRTGNLIFNELEEMVGSRMLYQCSSKDIVRDFVFWLYQTM